MATCHSPARTLRQQFPHEYNCWKAMRARCYNPRNASHRYYHDRGITVCERWRNSFAAFLEDMGPAPTSVHQIERRENAKGYDPDNCRWATAAEQQRNTSKCRWVEFNGFRLCIADWSIKTGLGVSTIRARLDRFGWSLERALTTPAGPSKKKRRRIRHKKKRQAVADLARQAGLNQATLRDRLASGWELERALSTPARPKRQAKRQATVAELGTVVLMLPNVTTQDDQAAAWPAPESPIETAASAAKTLANSGDIPTSKNTAINSSGVTGALIPSVLKIP